LVGSPLGAATVSSAAFTGMPLRDRT
jgi:hypothetical protein